MKKQAYIKKDLMNAVINGGAQELVQDKIRSLFGKLKNVDPEFANGLRKTISDAMKKIVEELKKIEKILMNNCRDDSQSFVQTIQWCKIFDNYDVFISKVAGKWAFDRTLDDLYNFRKLVNVIEKQVSRDREYQFIHANKEFFLSKKPRYVYLIPCDNLFNFNNVYELVFDHFAIINTLAKVVIRIIIHPKYDWVPIFDEKSRILYKRIGANIAKPYEAIMNEWKSQCSALYLNAIGREEHSVNFASAISTVADLSMENTDEIAEESLRMIDPGNKTEIYETARKIFGEKTLDILYREGKSHMDDKKMSNRGKN
jgi:hypothetical protein